MYVEHAWHVRPPEDYFAEYISEVLGKNLADSSQYWRAQWSIREHVRVGVFSRCLKHTIGVWTTLEIQVKRIKLLHGEGIPQGCKQVIECTWKHLLQTACSTFGNSGKALHDIFRNIINRWSLRNRPHTWVCRSKAPSPVELLEPAGFRSILVHILLIRLDIIESYTNRVQSRNNRYLFFTYHDVVDNIHSRKSGFFSQIRHCFALSSPKRRNRWPVCLRGVPN